MKVLSVVGQKGGPGKSTVVLHVAACAEAAGIPTAIIDTDPQATAFHWFERREAPSPQVTRETDADALPALLRNARANGIGLVIIDTPGKAETVALAACDQADLVLAPVRPTQADLETLGVVKRIARLAERANRTFIMLNQCPASSPGTIEEGRAGVAAYGLPLAPPIFHLRSDFARPLSLGLTATEHSPGGKAALEAAALFDWIRTELSLNPKDAR
jgi:chromosome partitioning protein